MKTYLIGSTALLISFCLAAPSWAYTNSQNRNANPANPTTPTNTMNSTKVNQGTMNDGQITKNIEQKYNENRTISGLKIGIITKNGVVILQGDVNTGTEASTLVELAQSVNGVTDVDTKNLKVKESNQPLTDTYITAKVKGLFIRAKLLGEKDVPVMSIKVDTKNGVVYLSGTAENSAQVANAVELAKSIQGVSRVENKVEISQAKQKSTY